MAMEPDSERDAALTKLSERIHTISTSTIRSRSATKAIRLDGLLRAPNGDEIIFDVSCCHPTIKKYIRPEYRRVQLLQAATDSKDVKALQTSIALQKLDNTKHDKYALIRAILRKQKLDGARSTIPRYISVLSTTLGEWNDGTTFLQEWLTARYKEKLAREGERHDSADPDLLAGDFRYRFRLRVLIGIAAGLAEQLLAAGLPGSCCKARSYSHQIHDISDHDSDSDVSDSLPATAAPSPNKSSSDSDTDTARVSDEQILQLLEEADRIANSKQSSVDAERAITLT
jgi:hypothetical protein